MADPAIKRINLIEETFQEDDIGRAKAERRYAVETDKYVSNDAALSLAEAYSAYPLPARAAAFSANRPLCRCTLRDVKRMSPTIWEISCSFEDPTSFTGGGDPTGHPATFVSGVEIEQEEYEYDGRGTRVCNSAGSRFTRMPTRPVQTSVCTITKIVNDAVKAAIEAASGTLNQNAVTVDGKTWAPGEAWLVLGQNAFTRADLGGANHVWTAVYSVRGKRGGWKQEVADIGHTSSTGKTPVELNRATSNPPMGWPLDGAGHFLAKYDDPPAKLTFYPAGESAWAGVPLT